MIAASRRRSVLAPAGPTAGKSCLARAAPVWMETMASTSTPTEPTIREVGAAEWVGMLHSPWPRHAVPAAGSTDPDPHSCALRRRSSPHAPSPGCVLHHDQSKTPPATSVANDLPAVSAAPDVRRPER